MLLEMSSIACYILDKFSIAEPTKLCYTFNANQEANMSAITFGEQLRLLRKALHMSLREVESLSGISNPYLSQLETDKIKQPSPRILKELAKCYQVPFETLMEQAGYISKTTDNQEPSLTLAGFALRSVEGLTPEEERAVLEYIDFIRQRRQK